MIPNNMVCDRVFAAELKSLGVGQESTFVWCAYGTGEMDIQIDLRRGFKETPEHQKILIGPALTAQELGVLLPETAPIYSGDGWLKIDKQGGGWRCEYCNPNGNMATVWQRTIADAMVSMLRDLIYTGKHPTIKWKENV